MENIYIEGHHGTYYVPTVNFNAETGICQLEGESYLEDTLSFFTPLISWLEEFLKTQDKDLIFNFKLDYYNTSSSKSIVDIFSLLKKKKDRGKKIEVNWYYNSFSEDAEEEVEEVEDFMLETGLKINLVPYEE
ncbi:MAG: DUF1987 domain-containing protein [Bacteroidales bacterium]|nr:DUF1987 domain-containing protein [Bacteroidales bacterium]